MLKKRKKRKRPGQKQQCLQTSSSRQGKPSKPKSPRPKSEGPRPKPRQEGRPKNLELVYQVRDFVREFKTHYNTCLDCLREYPPYVLEFDHLDPSAKRFNIGDASSVPNMEALQEEIAKCDLVCANCHRIREAGRKTSTGRGPQLTG